MWELTRNYLEDNFYDQGDRRKSNIDSPVKSDFFFLYINESKGLLCPKIHP